MGKAIHLADLPGHVRKTLEPENRVVPEKIVKLGKVLRLFEGMDRKDALWILLRARHQLEKVF